MTPSAPSCSRSRGHRRLVAGALAGALVALQLVAAAPARAANGLGVTAATVTEGNAGARPRLRFEVALTRDAGDTSTVNVDYRTVDGTAEVGRDYLEASGTLSFSGAATNRFVEVTVLGDNVDEADETLTLELLNPVNAAITQATATGTITDDDGAPVASVTDTTVIEGNAGTSPAVFVVRLSGPSGQTVTVNHATSPGTATAPGDFETKTGSVSFPPGTVTRSVTVDVAGDVLDEVDETFTLSLTGATGATVSPTAGEADATIEDDDAPPTVSIANAGPVDENAGPAQFTVSLSAPSGKDVTLTARTANGTATAPGDYSALTGSGNVTIPAGVTSDVVDVTVNEDGANELDETFTVTLSESPDATIVGAVATATIVDDDVPRISIDDVEKNEGGPNGIPGIGTTPFTFTVTRTGASGNLQVAYTVVDGTAKAADGDYTGAVSGVVSFTGAATTAQVTVNVVPDGLREGTETFTVTLTPVTGQPEVTIVAGGGAGRILNDDGPPARVRIDDKTVVEGTGGSTSVLFTVTVTDQTILNQAVAVTYATADGTATAPADYAPAAGTLVIGPGATSGTISVTVNPDALDEPDETFTVNLTSASNAVIDKGSGTATIGDDDAAPTVAASDETVLEGNAGTSLGLVDVTLSAPSGRQVTVKVAFADGSATAATDYVAPADQTLTFAPGETTRSLLVGAVGDGIDEFDELFNANLSEPVNADLAADANGSVLILDDDAAPRLSIDDASVEEPAGAGDVDVLSFEVTLSEESGRDVSFDFSTSDGTATVAAGDYQAGSGQVVIPAGELGGAVEVVVLGDDVDDPAQETLSVTLSGVTNALPPADPATGTILDTDGVPVFTISGASGVEGTATDGSAVVTVTLLPASAIAAGVEVHPRTGGTAPVAAGGDFDGTNSTLSFAPGETTKTVAIPLTRDPDDEADEHFIAGLENATGASVAAPGTAEVTIDDDDGPSVTVEGPTPVTEGSAGTADATFKVKLSAPSVQSVGVAYATANGSASAPGDFTAVNGSLTFNPGETTKDVVVKVNGDPTPENDETFSLGLANPVDATLATASAVAQITDDDRPALSVADASVVEGNDGSRTMTFTVTLTPAARSSVTLDYATADGTATAGSDYSATSGGLFFAAGETVRTVSVPVAGDTDEEPDETFSFTLSNFNQAFVNVTDATATGTIVDDDRAPLVSASGAGGSPDVTVTEGTDAATPAVFEIRLAAPRAFPVSVAYRTASQTAASGGDFATASGRVDFAPGDVTETVTVEVKGDRRDEATETFRLVLSDPSRAVVGDGEAVVTILDDDGPGYALMASDGGLFAFGGADFFGSTGNIKLNQPIVGGAAHPSGRGYWLVGTDGGLFAFGEAPFKGSTGNIKLNKPIVGMAATPSGEGYWLVASDGGLFAFGDAGFHGSTGAVKLNRPIVGMAATPSGEGYWLVASDGGLFAFGDAAFKGSTGAVTLNQPIVGMAANHAGDGYWLVARDGGIFAFGAPFAGSTGAVKLNQPIVGMAADPAGDGYWLVARDGGIFAFGAPFAGSTGAVKLNQPIVGMMDL